MNQPHSKTLVKGKKNKHIYLYHGEEKYTNLTTGNKGKIADADASKVFSIPLLLNRMVQENPVIIDLITGLGAHFDEE